jgi:adenine-specific DNA methylase
VIIVPVEPVVPVAVVPAVLVKHCRNNCNSIYWHHGYNCHSDYRSNRKYHRAIHSYISINCDKYFRNNSHCNYWHHWHHSYSE